MPASWRCPGHDAQNRLISATVAVTRETIAYDSRNRVVKRTVGGISTFYVYDGWDLIEEYNGGGTLQASYIHGVQADELISKTSGSTTVYYHQNANGNVACLTGAGGTVVENYKYDAFGTATITDGSGHSLTLSAYGNRFMFTGREYLSELGIYDYRNRDYSPSLGRFLQTDPIRNQILGWLARDSLEDDGGIDLYGYVGNNSINWKDPLGLYPSGYGPTGANGQPLGLPSNDGGTPWKWSPNNGGPKANPNSKGGTWTRKCANGKNQNASWDSNPKGPDKSTPGKPHWDFNDGSGGKSKIDENGNPVSEDEAHPSPTPPDDEPPPAPPSDLPIPMPPLLIPNEELPHPGQPPPMA